MGNQKQDSVFVWVMYLLKRASKTAYVISNTGYINIIFMHVTISIIILTTTTATTTNTNSTTTIATNTTRTTTTPITSH